ncbi:GmrSD restriction endonuclease domain-containing protein [Pseudarthrobacter sp. Y6]|uniref:HNH endonuclease family protein n=1 Tax=Pseudarthrobacter sp. Y6 TaxID=3418422 RepID=UPI003CF1EBD0
MTPTQNPQHPGPHGAVRLFRAGLCLLATIALAGCTLTWSPPAPEQAPPSAAAGATITPQAAAAALETLQTLRIQGRAPKTGYERKEFLNGWPSIKGCDLRNRTLARDLTDTQFKPGTNNCVVISGILNDPYTGQSIPFTRGQDTSSAIQIDHVVSIGDSWQKGAQQWDDDRKEAFAADPENLLAVDGPANMQKQDSDFATWQPPNKSFRCQYAAIQAHIKAKWQLWVTQAEHDAMKSTLTACA